MQITFCLGYRKEHGSENHTDDKKDMEQYQISWSEDLSDSREDFTAAYKAWTDTGKDF